MKVLNVITDTDRRGAQVFATDLATAMVQRGHDVDTVALAPGSSDRRLNAEPLGPSRFSAATLGSLRSAMKAADITIAHGSSTGPACAIATSRRRPFVYRQISDSVFWADTRAKRLRVAAVLRRAQRIVALSGDARATLVEHVWAPTDRIDVVPNGVSRRRFRPATPNERVHARLRLGLPAAGFVVGYVGALVPEKGVADAIRAVSALPGVTLLVTGDGPQRAQLERLAAEVDSAAVFTGALSDTASALHALDACVLPSRGGDSMPATLIEAAFCGVPAITTPIGSITDVVVDARTGLLIEPGDVDALALAIRRLRDDPPFRSALAEGAELHCVRSFEIETVTDQWLSVLKRACG